jgi:hypothetical protein
MQIVWGVLAIGAAISVVIFARQFWRFMGWAVRDKEKLANRDRRTDR